MALIGQSIAEFDFFPDAPPAIIGELTTGKTVVIELWKDGVAVSISASGCKVDTLTRRVAPGTDVMTEEVAFTGRNWYWFSKRFNRLPTHCY